MARAGPIGQVIEVVERSTTVVRESTSWGELTGVPSVLRNLGGEATSLLRDPRLYILGVIYEALVGGLLDFVASILGLILDAFGIAAGAPAQFLAAWTSAGLAIWNPIFGFISIIGEMLGSLIAVAGPFAPIIYAGIVYVAVRAMIEGVPLVLEVISPRLLAILKALIPGW